MLRLLTDENFNGDVVRGLRLRDADIDLVRVQDVGLLEAEDSSILAWAAREGRILLSHDRATMPNHACDRLEAGLPMPGVFIINDRYPVGAAIHELVLIAACSAQGEWDGRIVHLPL